LGARSRKRGRTAAAPPRAAAAPRPSRNELRDAEVRAELKPLDAGEHPLALKVAIGLALFIALSNVGLVLGGYEIKEDGRGTAGGAFVFAAVMIVAAWGMWKHRYWAVLGFQTLLMLTVIVAGLSLMVASNLAAVALCASLVGFGGLLFWKLVRVLSRIKTPSAFG
jgi:cation transport ATPase